VLEKIIAKPFEKEQELLDLKKDLSRLEREIALAIQAKQLITKETPVVKMEQEKDPPSLLPKLREQAGRGIKM
jgi:hypothetical protein